MIGSNGPRVLGIALPHVDAWNTWYEDYGNAADGFAALNERISAAARDAGRAPAEVERSACVLVALAGGGERPATAAAPAVAPRRLAAHLGELAEAGADEAILVADPISERSIRELGDRAGERRAVKRRDRPGRDVGSELASVRDANSESTRRRSRSRLPRCRRSRLPRARSSRSVASITLARFLCARSYSRTARAPRSSAPDSRLRSSSTFCSS